MGILRFYKWLNKELDIDRWCQESIDWHPHELYLDANCAIHPAVRASKLAGKTKVDEWCQDVWNYIYQLIEACKPSQLLFIALDGVAPLAKVSHQRQRRYHAKWLSEQSDDNNMISPGTSFMIQLEDYLEIQLEKHYMGQLKVVFSSTNQVGEGEHKIMDFIRRQHQPPSQTSGLVDNRRRVIYGLDSDLIFLSMLLPVNDVWLLREKQQSEELIWQYLSIDHLVARAIDRWNEYNWTRSKFIAKWTALTMFCGNDFVSGLAGCQIIDGSLTWMMQHVLGAATGDNLEQWLISWLTRLDQVEEARLVESAKSRRIRMHRGCPGDPSKLSEWAEQTTDLVAVDLGGDWQQRYYEHVMGHGVLVDNNNIARMCSDWYKSWIWSNQYYIGQCLDYKWTYPWSAAPLISDLLAWMQLGGPATIKWTFNSPISIKQQLNLIMPIQSRHLCSRNFWKYQPNGCSGWDSLTTFGCQWRSSCHLKLPSIVVGLNWID